MTQISDALQKIRFGVVGKATEQELKNYQIKADLVPDEQTGAGFAKALKNRSVTRRKSVYFSAKEASERLGERTSEILPCHKKQMHMKM